MKVRIQRIGHSEGFVRHKIDDQLVEGTIKAIRPGEEMVVAFNRIDDGTLYTTKIQRVEYLEGGMHVYTKNSIYRIVKGWDE